MSFFFTLCRAPRSSGREESPGSKDCAVKIVDEFGPIEGDIICEPATDLTVGNVNRRLSPDDNSFGHAADATMAFDPMQFAVDVLICGGQRYRKHRLIAQALMAFKSALAQQPSNEEALAGQQACALSAASTASAEAPDAGASWPPPPRPPPDGKLDPVEFSIDVLVQGAHHYFETGDFQMASRAYASVLTRRQRCEEALCGQVRALWSLGKIEDATAACLNSLTLLPGSTLLLKMASTYGVRLPADDNKKDVTAPAQEMEVIAVPIPKVAAKVKAKAKPKQDGAVAVANSEGLLQIETKTSQGGTGIKSKELKLEPMAQCPACRTDEDYKKELQVIKDKNREISQQSKNMQEKKHKQRGPNELVQENLAALSVSGSERFNKKMMFISFYKEQYARLKSSSVDLSKYSEMGADASGLSIKGGHQPMPRPAEGSIKLPPDFKQAVGVLTYEQLLRYDCFNHRMLISIHGDLFDVSDRPDKYGKDGPYWAMAGHDITWGLVSANDAETEFDKYYDIFKIKPTDKMERTLQGLMSWWAFYEKEYGEPVGRLDVYEKEWQLPTPPELDDACSVM